MNPFVLHLRDQKTGGPVTAGVLYRVLPNWDDDVWWNDRLPDFTLLTRGQRLTVLLHGFNNDREEGREKLVRFIEYLERKGSTDLMLAVLWPGDGWAGFLTYPFEGRDADNTADALLTWLLSNVHESARLAFVGHSLGCRVVMRAAQRMVHNIKGKKPILDRICLMAAAIDSDSLAKEGPTCYRAATVKADRIAVLASEQDSVLRWAYPMGDFIQTFLFQGERSGWALGRGGPEGCPHELLAKIDSRMANPDRDIGHSDYLPDPDKARPDRTEAESEQFVFEFLNRLAKPTWPAEGP